MDFVLRTGVSMILSFMSFPSSLKQKSIDIIKASDCSVSQLALWCGGGWILKPPPQKLWWHNHEKYWQDMNCGSKLLDICNVCCLCSIGVLVSGYSVLVWVYELTVCGCAAVLCSQVGGDTCIYPVVVVCGWNVEWHLISNKFPVHWLGSISRLSSNFSLPCYPAVGFIVHYSDCFSKESSFEVFNKIKDLSEDDFKPLDNR